MKPAPGLTVYIQTSRLHHHIQRSTFPQREQSFGDQDDVLKAFVTVQMENLRYFYFQSIWPNDVEHVALCIVIFTEFEVNQPIRSWLTTFILLMCYITLWYGQQCLSVANISVGYLRGNRDRQIKRRMQKC